MLDFSGEQEQKNFNYGPVPDDSCVFLKLLLMEPKRKDPKDKNIAIAESGLKQLPCMFTVEKGEYEGVWFYQNISLPVGMQTVGLTAGQVKNCNIGGATIKAILTSSRKPLQVQNFEVFAGLVFPAKLKVRDTPTQKVDKIDHSTKYYWNNEIKRVILPTDPEWAELHQKGEIINYGGATVGKKAKDFPDAPQAEDSQTGYTYNTQEPTVHEAMEQQLLGNNPQQQQQPQNAAQKHDDVPF